MAHPSLVEDRLVELGQGPACAAVCRRTGGDSLRCDRRGRPAGVLLPRGQTFPSPSLGPPLLSKSWSPPLLWGMPPEVDRGTGTWFPDAEMANQRPPNAVRPSPFVSPGFRSITKV